MFELLNNLVTQLNNLTIGPMRIGDTRSRTVIAACFSLLINLAYAFTMAVFGITSSSPWFYVLFIYYAILALTRFYAVTYALNERTKRTDQRVMLFCGRWLCALSFVLGLVVLMNVYAGRNASRSLTIMIVVAIYTICKALFAVINVKAAYRMESRLMITLRDVSCVDAAASIVSLQHSILFMFGSGAKALAARMDAITGLAAVTFVLVLGIKMIVQSKNESIGRVVR